METLLDEQEWNARTRKLIQMISSAFTRDERSNFFRLIKVIVHQNYEIEKQFEEILKAHVWETAYGKSLDYVAAMVNLKRRSNESDTELRLRIIFELMKRLAAGTKQEILDIFEFIGVKIEIIEWFDTKYGYQGYGEIPYGGFDPATFIVVMDAYDAFGFSRLIYEGYGMGGYGNTPYGGFVGGRSNSEILLELINQIKAAGVRVLLWFTYEIEADAKCLTPSTGFRLWVIGGEIGYGCGRYGYNGYGGRANVVTRVQGKVSWLNWQAGCSAEFDGTIIYVSENQARCCVINSGWEFDGG